METPLVDKQYLVEKFEGKGGWTYVMIPEIYEGKKPPFGMVRVRGFVDNFEIKQYTLMPAGNGLLFFPLKTTLRKKLGKGKGDSVHIQFFRDDSTVETPDELMVCLMDSPRALTFYESLSGNNQKYYIDWIYESKRLETKVNRIAKTIERLENRLKLYDY
jgi:hypothetical protein